MENSNFFLRHSFLRLLDICNFEMGITALTIDYTKKSDYHHYGLPLENTISIKINYETWVYFVMRASKQLLNLIGKPVLKPMDIILPILKVILIYNFFEKIHCGVDPVYNKFVESS